MKKKLSNWFLAGALCLSTLAFVTLSACGGGGSGNSNPAQSTGSVGIMLTDGPTDDFDKIELEIEKIELLGDDSRVLIFDGTGKTDEQKTVDLLDLANHSELFSLKSDIPAGVYNKIRLTLPDKGLALVKLNPDGTTRETVYPSLPGNGKLDLNPRGKFEVVAGQTSYLQVDLDAEKSIQLHQTGSGKYKFRPVVFVDVLNAGFRGKLVKVEGVVTRIDQSQNKLVLCPNLSEPGSEDDGFEGCTTVMFSGASIFDEQGDPTLIDDLTVDSKLTAVGFILFDDDDDLSSNDDVSSDDDDHTPSKMNAEVLELGGSDAFVVKKGPVKSAFTDVSHTFTMTDKEGSEVTVALQEGTKVFSKTGERLAFGDIQTGNIASVDGVFSGEPDGLFKSALIILQTLPSPEKIQGTLQSADSAAKSLTLELGETTKTILVNEKTLFFRISKEVDGMLSAHATIEDLQPGQELDVYGSETSEGFVATVVLWEE